MSDNLTKKEPVGKSVIDKIAKELVALTALNSDFNLNILNDNVILNITPLITEEYSEDLSKFKVITSQIGIMAKFLDKEVYRSDEHGGGYGIERQFMVRVFSDNKISNLEQVNLSDMLGLFDIELSDFPYLSKCTFHFNRLYNKDQIGLIPSIEYIYYWDN